MKKKIITVDNTARSCSEQIPFALTELNKNQGKTATQ
jgi:hypothetical protein